MGTPYPVPADARRAALWPLIGMPVLRAVNPSVHARSYLTPHRSDLHHGRRRSPPQNKSEGTVSVRGQPNAGTEAFDLMYKYYICLGKSVICTVSSNARG